MMTRQSMARVSSASTEADFAPGMVPFDWEAAPGRSGRKSIKSAVSGRGSLEVPSLPLPPGRRPDDDSPDLRSEVKLESDRASSQPRKLFNLNFPGSQKKPPSTSRMRLPFQSSTSKPAKDSHVDEDHSFSIFNPVSGHRFGSSITRRMLEQLTKKQSLWRRCLPSTLGSEDRMKGSSSSHMGRRLDSVDEGYVITVGSPVSGPSLSSSPGHGAANWSNSSPVVTKHVQPSSPGHGDRQSSNSSPAAVKQSLQPPSPGHGHGHSSNSSPVGSTRQLLQPSSPRYGHSSHSSPVATKKVQVASSRFMASMLISLCPEADEPHFDAVDEISDNRSSSPEVLHETSPAKPSECSEIVVDPASHTVLSHEECRCTCKHRAQRIGLSTLQRKKMSRSVSRSLHEELATARSPSEHFRRGKLESATKLDQSTVAHQKGNADAYPVFSKAFADRESVRRREPYHSSFSWKPCTEKSRPSQEPAAVTSDIAQDPGDSEFAKEIFEVDVGEKHERRAGNRSLATGSNSSSSSESNWRHSAVASRPCPSSPSVSKDVYAPMSKSKCGAPLGYLSPPRASSGESEYSSNRDKPKAFVRWKSNVEPSTLRKGVRSERTQPPATRATINFLSPPRKQASQQSAVPIRTKDRKPILKSSSQRRVPSTPLHDTDDSDDDSECSTDSSQYNNTPRSAVTSSSNSASPKPASHVNLLKSPSQLKFKLQRQQSHHGHMVDRDTALPGPSFKQILMARSHSVRSSSTRVFTSQECYAVSADTNLRGSDPPPASRLAKTSSTVMSRVAEWEAKAGVGSSGKSAPLYRFNQRTLSTSSTAGPSYTPAAR